MTYREDQLSARGLIPADSVSPQSIVRRDDVAGANGTPERFDPAQMRARLIGAEYLARYRFAAPAASGKTVLDAGCGWAYGAELLAQAGAESVVGIDISETVIEAAREQVDPRVSLEVADLTDLPFESGSFDLVVCFETIEHLRDQSRALDELARVLADGGLLLISSPNDAVSGGRDPYQLHHFTREELRDDLGLRFQFVELYSQQDWVMSLVSTEATLEADDLELAALPALKTAGLARGQGAYLLAVASNVPISPLEEQAVLSVNTEPKDWLERWEAQDQYLRELQSELETSANRRLVPIERRFLETRLDVAEAERRAARAERDVHLIKSSISWRVTAPFRRNPLLRALFRRDR
jgi:ubiquinone/menaquinone biosynthesis C-methylase UbiE